MSHMKWVYSMVQDGTIEVFKMLYNNAVKYKLDGFIFESKSISTSYARGIIELAVAAELEYDKHIDTLAAQDNTRIL